MELRIVRHTTDFDAACRFFGELLGWPVTRQWPAGDGQGRGRIFGYGDAARMELIELATATDERPVSGLLLSVEHADVAALHDLLVGAGIDVAGGLADQPWGHRNFTIHAPGGVEMVFFQVLSDPDQPHD